MPVNFDALVFAPCMRAFAIPVMMDPMARCRWPSRILRRASFRAVGRAKSCIQDGTIVADMETTLGIRMSDFLAPPTTKDQITLQSTVMDVNGQPHSGRHDLLGEEIQSRRPGRRHGAPTAL